MIRLLKWNVGNETRSPTEDITCDSPTAAQKHSMYLRKPINQGTIQFVNKQVSDSLPLSRWEGGADKKHQPPLPARTRHVLQSQLLEAENSHIKHLFADFLTLS
jgi:hypothetical protein